MGKIEKVTLSSIQSAFAFIDTFNRLSLSTKYHDTSHSQFSTLLHMATFSYTYYIKFILCKIHFIFYYTSRLLFKTITYLK